MKNKFSIHILLSIILPILLGGCAHSHEKQMLFSTDGIWYQHRQDSSRGFKPNGLCVKFNQDGTSTPLKRTKSSGKFLPIESSDVVLADSNWAFVGSDSFYLWGGIYEIEKFTSDSLLLDHGKTKLLYVNEWKSVEKN